MTKAEIAPRHIDGSHDIRILRDIWYAQVVAEMGEERQSRRTVAEVAATPVRRRQLVRSSSLI